MMTITDESVHAWQAFAPDCFTGRVTVVTGAAGGIGLEAATAFHAHGARVVMADVNSALLGKAAARLPGATAVPLDVADSDQVATKFAQISAEHGPIDHLVHAAAIITAKPFLEQDAAHWRRVLDVNLVGSFSVVKAALGPMADRGAGTIVVVASDAGFRGGGGLIADAPYAASKAGVLSLVKSVAREFAGSGVRINALVPGPTDTPLHSGVSGELKQRIAAGLPVRRMGRPDDMAAAILFLSSPAARFVYGSALDVDGGSMLR
jgi:3-oxoacyl-[acyl-carrier protein] reductase